MQPPLTTIRDWGLPTPLRAHSNRLAEFILRLGHQGVGGEGEGQMDTCRMNVHSRGARRSPGQP